METALALDIKPGDVITIDEGRIKLELVHKSGRAVRLRFLAPEETEIKLIKQAVRLRFVVPTDTENKLIKQEVDRVRQTCTKNA